MKPVSRHLPLLLALAIFLLIMILGIIGDLQQQFRQSGETWQQWQNQQRQQQLLTQQIRDFAAERQRLTPVQQRLQLAITALPSPTYVTMQIPQFIHQGQKMGWQFITWQPQSLKRHELYHCIPVQIDIRGTAAQLRQFFLTLQQTFPQLHWRTSWQIQHPLPAILSNHKPLQSDVWIFQGEGEFYTANQNRKE